MYVFDSRDKHRRTRDAITAVAKRPLLCFETPIIWRERSGSVALINMGVSKRKGLSSTDDKAVVKKLLEAFLTKKHLQELVAR